MCHRVHIKKNKIAFLESYINRKVDCYSNESSFYKLVNINGGVEEKYAEPNII